MGRLETGSKYARLERERRFLLRQAPGELALDDAHRAIYDRYVRDTRFRLRRIVDSLTQQQSFKLTQKYIPTGGGPATVVITNTYLSADEYAVFATLPADELWKKRYRTALDGRSLVVDIFVGPLEGLILAEIEFASDQEMGEFTPPDALWAEVSDDLRFTGGYLCRQTFAGMAPLIDDLLSRPRQAIQT